MIDTQAIRNKILDLAIQGKLTKQLPKDGTAEELYRQIQEEKQELIKTGKIKKEKPLPKITEDEIPFEIPRNWKWVRLSDFGSFSGGKTPSMVKKEFWDNGSIPWITSKDMKQKYIYSSEIMVSDLGAKELTVYPEKTVLLVVRSGILRRMLPVAILKTNGTINQDLKALQLYRPEMCEYAYYVLKGFESTILFKYAKDGTTVNNIIFDTLLAMPVPLPSLAEQKRIVEKIEQTFSILDTIDELQTKYANNLSALKSKLIDLAIQGKLTKQLPEDGTAEELYQQIQQEKQELIKAGKIKKEKPLPKITEDEKPFDIPRNWKWVRVATIGITVTGGTPAKSHPEYYGGDYPFFKPSDLDAGRHITIASEYLSESGKAVARRFSKNSILVCCIGSIGKSAIIDNEGTANQQINALTPVICDSDYLLYAINSDCFFHQLNFGSRATTVSIISKSKFDDCIVPLPPLAEQKRIVEKLEEVLAVCDSLPKMMNDKEM